MNRRTFISALLASGVTLLTRAASAKAPSFNLVRSVLEQHAKRLPDARLTLSKMARPVQTWKGKVTGSSPIELKGKDGKNLKLAPGDSNAGDTGRQLIAALLNRKDFVEGLETLGSGIDTTRASIEVHGEHTLAYRFGSNPSIVVCRERWRLLEFQLKQESVSWVAYVSYSVDDRPTLIRVTQDGAARWTARLAYD